jgi:hypothetical protein
MSPSLTPLRVILDKLDPPNGLLRGLQQFRGLALGAGADFAGAALATGFT